MLFNSFEFFLFLPCVLLLYYVLSQGYQNAFLLAASYFFYGFWDYRFLSLLVISTVVDFICGQKIHRAVQSQARRFWLTLSVCTNLGLLGFFKYFNFFCESFTVFLDRFGLSVSSPVLYVVLPVGISFYTFQTMSYTIDIYRRQAEPTRDFLSFALYVAYFPQLVAGPIERSTRLLPQILTCRRVDNEMISDGARLILTGYIQKVFIADSVAPYVDKAFQAPNGLAWSALLMSLYLFSIQIYCDFAGYSNIARGVSKLLGIDLMVNFRQPYLSTNITAFWRHWHISLSAWLKDYLYIPLGGNRHGRLNTYRNLMLTMLLGGLWHGASWTFVVWGGCMVYTFLFTNSL